MGAPGRGRDPNLYFLSIFGEPGSAAWGWRFGGHHLSLHYTVLNGHLVSSTPSFFGADPADTELAGGSVLRPLGRLEDLGRELLHALNDDQRARAVLAPVAPPDLVTANRTLVEEGAVPLPSWELLSFVPGGRVLEAQRASHERYRRSAYSAVHEEAVRYSRVPKGLPAAMTPTQRAILTARLRQYTDRLPEEAAVVAQAKVSGAALEAVHFAWAGSRERGQPHYYRLQGPRVCWWSSTTASVLPTTSKLSGATRRATLALTCSLNTTRPRIDPLRRSLR